MRIDHHDCRTGGSYRCLHSRDGEDFGFHGGNGRTRLTATSLVDSFAERDAFVASGTETGVVQGYERLDEILARG